MESAPNMGVSEVRARSEMTLVAMSGSGQRGGAAHARWRRKCAALAFSGSNPDGASTSLLGEAGND